MRKPLLILVVHLNEIFHVGQKNLPTMSVNRNVTRPLESIREDLSRNDGQC